MLFKHRTIILTPKYIKMQKNEWQKLSGKYWITKNLWQKSLLCVRGGGGEDWTAILSHDRPVKSTFLNSGHIIIFKKDDPVCVFDDGRRVRREEVLHSLARMRRRDFFTITLRVHAEDGGLLAEAGWGLRVAACKSTRPVKTSFQISTILLYLSGLNTMVPILNK